MMKKVWMTAVIVGICSILVIGCGKQKSDTTEKVKQEQNAITETESESAGIDADNEENDDDQKITSALSREEINELFKQMEKLKGQYDATTTPSEIEAIAKEFNRISLEAREAYILANGVAPNIELIPRREYLAKMAFYGVAIDYIEEYNEFHMAFTGVDDTDYDGNPFPQNIIVNDGYETKINPENGDSILYFIKSESIEGISYMKKLLIIRDGGRSTIEVDMDDLVDERIIDIRMDKEHVVFDKGGRESNYYLFKFDGDTLKLEEEYFEYDNIQEQPLYEYCNDRFKSFGEVNVDHIAWRDAEQELHFTYDE